MNPIIVRYICEMLQSKCRLLKSLCQFCTKFFKLYILCASINFSYTQKGGIMSQKNITNDLTDSIDFFTIPSVLLVLETILFKFIFLINSSISTSSSKSIFPLFSLSAGFSI